MSFTSWLFPQQSLARRAGHGHNTKPNRLPSRKLVLEHLEDRRLLSVTLGANFEGIDLSTNAPVTGVMPEFSAASGPNNVVEIEQ